MANWLGRYRTSLISTATIVAVGIWPILIAPLGHAYIALCARFLTDAPVGHHYPPLLVAFLTPIIACLGGGVALALLRQVREQRRLEITIARRLDDGDDALRQLVEQLGLTGRVRQTRDRTVYAFCGGLIRPRIYLSRGLLELLTAEELEVVLRHERHHLLRHDPLRYFTADLLGRLGPCVPALTTLANRVRINAELAADRAAVQQAPIDTLASALVKVMRASPAMNVPGAIAALSPNDARVLALLGQPAELPFDRRDLAVSVVFACSVAAVLVWLGLQPLPLPPACDTCPPF